MCLVNDKVWFVFWKDGYDCNAETDLTESKSKMPGNGLRQLLTVVQGRDHVNSDRLAPEKMKREEEFNK